MSPFEVIKLDEGWGVFGVNPNNPNDRVLANVCETQAYAEMLANGRLVPRAPSSRLSGSGAEVADFVLPAGSADTKYQTSTDQT